MVQRDMPVSTFDLCRRPARFTASATDWHNLSLWHVPTCHRSPAAHLGVSAAPSGPAAHTARHVAPPGGPWWNRASMLTSSRLCTTHTIGMHTPQRSTSFHPRPQNKNECIMHFILWERSNKAGLSVTGRWSVNRPRWLCALLHVAASRTIN